MTDRQEVSLHNDITDIRKDIEHLKRWLQGAIAVGLIFLSAFAWQINAQRTDINRNEDRVVKALEIIAAHSVSISTLKESE